MKISEKQRYFAIIRVLLSNQIKIKSLQFQIDNPAYLDIDISDSTETPLLGVGSHFLSILMGLWCLILIDWLVFKRQH